MKKLIITTLMVIHTIFSYCQSDFQPGYIITNDGDTLHGYVDFRGEDYNARKCAFRLSSEGPTTTYSPGEITAYHILGGRYYISADIVVDDEEYAVFLEQLVDGKASLYALAPGIIIGREEMYASARKLFFLETAEHGLQILENTETIIKREGQFKWVNNTAVKTSNSYVKVGHEYIAILKVNFQDQFELMDEIERTKFEQADLIRITTKYHELACPDEACIIYSKEGPKIKNRIAFIAGTHTSMLKISDPWVSDETGNILCHSATGYVAGFQIESYSAGFYERFFSRISILYSEVTHEYADAGSESHIKYSTFHLGMSLNYMYPRYRLKPFAGVGVYFMQSFENDESYIGSDWRTYNPARRSIGPEVNLGANYELGPNMNLKLQASYYYEMFRNSKDTFYESNINTLQIAMGLSVLLNKK